ncbi:hypothetical protein [Amycolatopsis sp. CA-230715]|uniref:hypothetical protein n=1 Tax=Amycolatopsis sp. CA-230715 TaxID=2745196 RepID=UPI001C328CF5|nr:hypothetical protein [Amycolatopsis sp. CA-230715]QWF79039.1 hypothetical protein HUW46_02443 [Amycolatopsis sp. CA-230715]
MTRPSNVRTDLPSGVVDFVSSIHTLREAGVSGSTIAGRCRPGGPWRRLLPGVLLLSNGEPTRNQQLRAAVTRAGPPVVVTGVDALCAHGIALPRSRTVHLLLPTTRRILPHGFATHERTARLPEPVLVDGLPFAPVARATIDAARWETDPDRLRRLLSLPVYYGLCTGADLNAELEAGNQRGTRAVRDTLRGLGSLGDTYVQGMARRLLRTVPLPPPAWNVTVCDRLDRPIGLADAWWDEVGVAWQFGARGTGEAGGKMSHLALRAAGVVVVRTAAGMLQDSPACVREELVRAFVRAARRERPPVIAQGMLAAA